MEELALPKERIEELLERVIGDRRGHIEDWLVELPERSQHLVTAFSRPGVSSADDQDVAAVQVLRERGGPGNTPEDGIQVHLVGRTQGEIRNRPRIGRAFSTGYTGPANATIGPTR